MPPTPPTLINLPPAPKESFTPTEAPGTPNSAMTSMSELSTVAIKDGHRGHLPHQARNAPVPDAERADRISRLAGLERVATATARQPTPISQLTPGAAAPPFSGPNSTSGHGASSYHGGGTSAFYHQPGVGYFDATGNPTLGRERSTVGSASATGSVAGRTTTWASASVGASDADRDKLSEPGDVDGDVDMELDRSSVGGVSSRADDDTGSLVGFGEGARTPARASAYGSPQAPAMSKAGSLFRDSVTPIATGPTGIGFGTGNVQQGNQQQQHDSSLRRHDAVPREGAAAQTAEKILKDRIGGDEQPGLKPSRAGGGIGPFKFEEEQ